MIMFALALAAAHPVRDTAGALELCRPILAREAGGDIASIEVASTRRTGKMTTIEGRLTAFLGMGPPQPGSASTHHLIRSDFAFTCRVDRRKVRAVRVNPTH